MSIKGQQEGKRTPPDTCNDAEQRISSSCNPTPRRNSSGSRNFSSNSTTDKVDSSSSSNHGGNSRVSAVSATQQSPGTAAVENHKRSILDIYQEEESVEKNVEETWNDFVLLEDREFPHGYVAKFQRLCSRSDLSVSIHERVSARLESKRKLRLSRHFSFVEKEKRARERHQEYLNKRKVVARKFIEREVVLQRQQRFVEERTKTLELRVSRLDKRLLEQIEEDVLSKSSNGEEKQKKGGKEEQEEQDSVDVGDDVFLHQKRAEEHLASRIEGIQANLRKKMESADERRRQLREQEKVRLARALQQVEKVQEKKQLEEEEKSIKLQEKLEEAERRRRQLLEEESQRRKQKWEKREGVASREQDLEVKKKVLEERVELAIERKNKIIEETKLTIQKKLTDAEEQLHRNRSEMEKRLQDMAEKILQKQEKAEQLRIENLKKKAASPSRHARARGTPSAKHPAAAAVEETVAG